MKTDTLFYRLFQRWPKLALELLGLEYASESYRFSSEEIKQTAFRLDGLFTPVADNAEQPLIFVEVQYQPDNEFYGRFFSEITLYLRLHKPAHPWLAMVIYPTRSTEKPASIAFKPFMGLPGLHRIYLDDYQDSQGLTPALELVRLIASREQQTIELARNLAERRDEFGPDGLDFIETILVYKLPRLSREEIKTMLALNDIELKQTRFYQEIAEEERQIGEQIGEQKGEQKGRQKGRQEGRQEGEQILLQRMLTRRFGEFPDWAQKRLLQANSEQLEQWADRLLDAPSLDAVFND